MPAAKHIRQQIREKAILLLTGLTTTGANVFKSRLNPVSEEDGELPCIEVGTDAQNSTSDQVMQRSQGSQVTAAGRSTMRTMKLVVRGKHKQVADIDDKLDTISLEVEAALLADVFLGGLSSDTRLMDTTISLNGDGDKPVGEVTMNFEVDYWCTDGAPSVTTN